MLDCVVPENIHTPPLPPPPPHPSGNSNLASYIALNFGSSRPPLLPGISNPFCGGSMDMEPGFNRTLQLQGVSSLRWTVGAGPDHVCLRVNSTVNSLS